MFLNLRSFWILFTNSVFASFHYEFNVWLLFTANSMFQQFWLPLIQYCQRCVRDHVKGSENFLHEKFSKYIKRGCKSQFLLKIANSSAAAYPVYTEYFRVNNFRNFWNGHFQCQDTIERSLCVATKLLEDVDLHLLVHSQYGKGFMKKCRVSPDAYIQMALQLAYFRVSTGGLLHGEYSWPISVWVQVVYFNVSTGGLHQCEYEWSTPWKAQVAYFSVSTCSLLQDDCRWPTP